MPSGLRATQPGEQHLELRNCPLHVGRRRPGRDTQLGTDLLVGEMAPPAQQHDLPLSRRQGLQGTSHQHLQVIRILSLFREQRCGLYRVRGLEVWVGASLDFPVSQPVPGEISRDRVKKASGVGARVEPVAVLPQAEEGLLRGVPRVLAGAEKGSSVSNQSRRLPVEELAEGLGLAGRDP